MKEYDFYIVPTPIGNLGDITLRALEILKKVDIIACEDVRVTQKLLNHFDIKTKCISYHKFNEKERIEKFLEILAEGKKIALVSDAGTPLFCDPGAVIVEELRKHGFTLTALAGANAVVTFLSQVARDGEDFIFVGFPKVAVARELTKIFEEIVVDSCENTINHFKNNIVKGEIAALVFRDKTSNSEINLDEKIAALKKKNFKAKEIAAILSALYNLNKNDVYKKIIEDLCKN